MSSFGEQSPLFSKGFPKKNAKLISQTRATPNLIEKCSRPSTNSTFQMIFLLRVRFETSSGVTELSQHEADGGKFQERESIAVEIFPILGETATTIEPCDGSLDDPTLG